MKVGWQSVDVKDYTLHIYSPERVTITDSKNATSDPTNGGKVVFPQVTDPKANFTIPTTTTNTTNTTTNSTTTNNTSTTTNTTNNNVVTPTISTTVTNALKSALTVAIS